MPGSANKKKELFEAQSQGLKAQSKRSDISLNEIKEILNEKYTKADETLKDLVKKCTGHNEQQNS